MMKVAKRESRHPVRVDTGTLGKTDAAHATATGKAMLAWLPEDDMRRVLSHGLTRFTPKTICEWPSLIEALRHVRRNGYAVDDEEYQPGVICIGAAIRDHNGAVVGAISASTPTMRANDEHLSLVREQVCAAVRSLSAELGGPEHRRARRLPPNRQEKNMYAPPGDDLEGPAGPRHHAGVGAGRSGRAEAGRQAGAGAEARRGAGAHRRGRDLRDRPGDHLARPARLDSGGMPFNKNFTPGHEYMWAPWRRSALASTNIASASA